MGVTRQAELREGAIVGPPFRPDLPRYELQNAALRRKNAGGNVRDFQASPQYQPTFARQRRFRLTRSARCHYYPARFGAVAVDHAARLELPE